MAVISDLVRQQSTTTGTGNFILSASTGGWQTFAGAFGTGATTNIFYYFIYHTTLNEWECGMGHMADATTLVRDTLISSSTGAFVSFTAGTKIVVCDIPATRQIDVTLVTGITAGGTNQATATLLVGDFSTQIIGTSAGSGGVRLPTPTTKSNITITNRGVGVARIYPTSGHSINGMAVNTPVFIYPNQSICFTAVSTTGWQTPQFSNGSVNSTSPQFPYLLTISSTGVVAGYYGAPDNIPQFYVGNDGRLQYAGNVGVSIPWTSVYNFGDGVTTYAGRPMRPGKVLALSRRRFI